MPSDRLYDSVVRRRLVGIVAALAVMGTPFVAAAGSAAPLAAQRSHVVLAVIENGLNVYHHDFAAPGRQANPATWLAGYPTSSTPLRLHLHEKDLPAAIERDDTAWRGLKAGQLYYLPGTRISGLVYLPSPLDKAATVNAQFDSNNPTGALAPPRPVIDDNTFHGTGVASVAAGTSYGTCPDCDIVLVAAANPEQGLAWAAQQPWIDVISNSWGGQLGLPTKVAVSHPGLAADTGASAGSLAAAQAGHLVVFGSGNGVTDLGPTTHGTQHSLTWDTPYAGPPWVLTVGASKPSGQPTDWHNIPVDVIAQGEQRPGADYQSLTGESPFYGTSCSGPVAAGVIAEALYKARARLGDQHVGPTGGLLRAAGWRTPLAPNGSLNYLGLIRAAKLAATWKPFDPASMTSDPFLTPTTDKAYTYEGYGLLDRATIAPLTNLLTGAATPPARPEMIQWDTLATHVRSTRWGTPPTP